jgi:hypothetical protein
MRVTLVTVPIWDRPVLDTQGWRLITTGMGLCELIHAQEVR